MSKEIDESKGKWRTICGRKVFIAKGQTLSEAMKASGKFEDEDISASSEFDKEERITEKAADVLGKEFKGLKGQEAVKKLLQEKCGHIKNAFMRPDIGGITLMWGDDGSGIQHIINERNKKDHITDMEDFLSDITDVIEKGEVIKINDKGRIEILRNGKMAIIAPHLRDGRISYLFTAYKTRKKNTDDD